MNNDSTTKTELHQTSRDWEQFDAMTKAQHHAAALSDPDAQPLAPGDVKRMKRTPQVKIIRRALGLSQEDFSTRFRIPLGTLRDWEQSRKDPDAAARAYLRVIARNPDAVIEALQPIVRKGAAVNQAYMLDTNVFNDLLEGKISLASFADRCLFIVGVQADELRATQGIQRRAALLDKLVEVDPTTTLASTFAFDIEGAGFNQACWNDGSGTFELMLARLQQLDGKTSNERNHKNQLRDILIAETAIKNCAILISSDVKLRQVVSEFGGSAIDLSQNALDAP
jgi:putative transcriptional regulator